MPDSFPTWCLAQKIELPNPLRNAARCNKSTARTCGVTLAKSSLTRYKLSLISHGLKIVWHATSLRNLRPVSNLSLINSTLYSIISRSDVTEMLPPTCWMLLVIGEENIRNSSKKRNNLLVEMSSFFSVGALGGNPFSTPVGQRIGSVEVDVLFCLCKLHTVMDEATPMYFIIKNVISVKANKFGNDGKIYSKCSGKSSTTTKSNLKYDSARKQCIRTA
ncbi:hypothetical protein Bhyg_09322 [Pseudolycoriella hygida]|uniref:Uncharacterized protein n=1 Tax=Pseudolycoriella hygida TaxID=35572 RepID=A0A9Q0S4B1_9DIPT|nr:hypothetical protein Bhyg_09322 [Pseudolycoriella hygida]